MSETASVRRVAVIGAGTIGASWAAYFLSRGLHVTAWDPRPDAETFVRRFISDAWPALSRLGLAAGADPERVRFAKDAAAAVAGAEFVQENGPEREDLKIELFRALDGAVAPEIVIASSSSGLLMSRIQEGCRHPGRCVIGHPFNPPHLIPLVEVVGGHKTAPDAVARAMAFYAQIGKEPIHVRKEVKGHIANRLQAALWREAVHLLAEDVASVADIDKAIAFGPGLRWAFMGPNTTFHLAGGEGGMAHFLAHLGTPMESWWADLGAPRLSPEIRKRIVDGVADAVGGRSIPELAAERDRRLLAILAALAR
ncbi:MAG TPA: 3-hydroxyacyl-CoA dehydrogenase NAD-binding domain-containing protein [Alphaproteobacteria bacterium]|nr:3-hydroxyacyl-CoA dehydrogenase NAD-binding domain-containing protein [Alphaproteobacteria bacterium]